MARICRRKHYSYKEKKLILESFYKGKEFKNASVKEFSEICGISGSTLKGWLREIDYDLSNIEKLKTKARKKPKAVLTESKLSEPIQTKILTIKEKNPSWGNLKIKQYLYRSEQILIPGTTIYKFLKEKGLIKERVKGNPEEKAENPFEYSMPLEAVQMDLMHVTLSKGTTIYLVTLLDDYSRFVLDARFIPVKTMDQVSEIFRNTIKKYGVMDHLLTDQGSEFVSWQNVTRFENMLVELDVEYIASGPQKKGNQGKVERWHQTVREGLRERGPLDFSYEAQIWIRELSALYNYDRPHQGIGGLYPADRFFGMQAEIETELKQCERHPGGDRTIYLVLKWGEHKLVISGPRIERTSLWLNGTIIPTPGKTDENLQMKKKV